MQDNATFGPALRAVRRELGLSQIALAGVLSTTQRHVSFLETGRTAPSRAMVTRIATGLALNGAQRNALFAASGFRTVSEPMTAEMLAATLDMLERQILGHWPYPAFVLDRDWDILRRNGAAARMLRTLSDDGQEPGNLMIAFLSGQFMAAVQNWQEISANFYFRLQAAAERSAMVRHALDDARARGFFSDLTGQLTGSGPELPFQPIIMRLPDGTTMQMSSLLARLGSAHDALIDDIEIELIFPVDAESTRVFEAILGTGHEKGRP